MTTRRSFIRQMGAASVVAVGAQPPALFARAAEVAPPVDPDGRILVLVQLAGGNDGLNTVAPFDNDAYRRLRPSLALNRNAVHKLNDQLGLHPWKWVPVLNGRCWTVPVLANGRIYCRNAAGDLVCLDVREARR